MKYFITSKNVLLLSLGLCVFLVSCEKNETAPQPQLVKEITVSLAAANENPQPAGRTESGSATVKIYADNSISVDATLVGLSAADNLTMAHFHVGDPVTNGPVVLDLKPTFTGGSVKATLTSVRTSFIDSIKAGTADIYLNVHSSQVGSGLVRGQLFNPVTFAASVSLAGANEVPAVTTTATGVALLRLTADNKLYSKITVSNLEATDALTMAHIHSGAAGANGGVLIGLCSSAADFGITKMNTPSPAVINSIKADAVYVNVHSTTRPSGIIRGQIR
jgi:hypothetical protein